MTAPKTSAPTIGEALVGVEHHEITLNRRCSEDGWRATCVCSHPPDSATTWAGALHPSSRAAARDAVEHLDAVVEARQHLRTTRCACPPCPGRGNDGHGMTHCAECCFGSGVEADIDCPIHGDQRTAVGAS